jgi:glycosyltransferase involved in cell wall biosynthesis
VKVLYLSSAGTLYGGEHSLLHVVRRLDPAQWEPHFVVPRPGQYETLLRDSGLPVTAFDVTSGLGGGNRHELRTLVGLAAMIRRTRAGLVHLNHHFAAPLVSAACLITGVPLVVHVRNMIGEKRPRRLDRFFFRRIPTLICISEAVRDRLLATELADDRTAGRITIIADGRDLAPFHNGDRARVRRELGIANGAPLVGMIARFEPMKGQDIFLEAAMQVADRLPDARFALVGDVAHPSRAGYRGELERLAARPPLAGRVSFLGYRHDIPDILAALDCFVHSSRRGAFVSVLIEAMAAGVPIVATDVDGIPECLGRDGAAELVPADPLAFAEAIVRVVTDPARSASMTAQGKARASARFDVEPLARATEAVFTQAVT